MQALGQLTGGIAHDFNNLLTVIQGSADMLRRPGLAEDKRIRFAEAVVQASSRAAALTGQLLAFARRQPLQPEVIDVNALIRGMTDLLDRTLGERIEVRTALVDRRLHGRGRPRPARIGAAQHRRQRARRHARWRPAHHPHRAGRRGRERGAMIALSVSDSGGGMDEDTLDRAFEPFFTTKATGKGTGLGLSQVYGFASQSGGDVRIDSRPGAGTTVTLLLPCQRHGRRDAGRGETIGRRGAAGTGRILLVEDNDEVGEFAEHLLDELGHEVVRVRSGEEALERALAEEFDARLHRRRHARDERARSRRAAGRASARACRSSSPPAIATRSPRSGAGGRPVILKPYRLETLAAAIDQALGDGAK